MNERFFDLKKARQDQIINGAMRIFAENGYKHASTDEMVAAAGISKGLLFHYFKSKKGTWLFLYEYCTRYMLLEFFPDEYEEDACYCIDRILQAGYHPVLAHAERCDFVNEQSVKRLRAAGVTVQINVYSVFEEHSDTIRSRANMLLRNRLVDFTGSDAHRMDHRPPACLKGIDYLYRTCDRDYVDLILTGNAGRLLCRNHHSVPN